MIFRRLLERERERGGRFCDDAPNFFSYNKNSDFLSERRQNHSLLLTGPFFVSSSREKERSKTYRTCVKIGDVCLTTKTELG